MERPAPLGRFDVGLRFLSHRNHHHNLMITGGQTKIVREPAAIEAFHGAGVDAQCFGSDHQILAGQRCALDRPFEQVLARHGRHPHHLPQIQQPEQPPFHGAKDTEWSGHEQDPADLCCPLVVANFRFAELTPAARMDGSVLDHDGADQLNWVSVPVYGNDAGDQAGHYFACSTGD
jgi:hypothetical protein